MSVEIVAPVIILMVLLNYASILCVCVCVCECFGQTKAQYSAAEYYNLTVEERRGDAKKPHGFVCLMLFYVLSFSAVFVRCRLKLV